MPEHTRQSLYSLIEDHRALHQVDFYLPQMVSRHPPVTIDLNTGIPEEEPAAVVGMNLNARLLRLIGHPDGYGVHHPWASAAWQLRWHCRRDHRPDNHTENEAWGGALCQRLVTLVIAERQPLPEAALKLEIDTRHAAALLRSALVWIEHRIDAARQDELRRTTLVDHRMKGLHFSEPAA
jgi:hypothetical protein